MYLSDMKKAISEAKATLRAADMAADELASVLRGRLRQVGNRYCSNQYQCSLDLDALKRELKDWNMNTHTWRNE